ncbi:hypothetical protein VTL71DRAFT_548 [Oculimacula yallundae]|uniref:Uncharacterized protein n=1 Tax=Oculimacula yallundae TaxID=86028 RepID=A0ABR4D0H8_9HELO
MAPNLFLCVKKTVTPWTWCSPRVTSNSGRMYLYSGNEPVEGLYAISPRGKRYLVAVMPNGDKDVDNIFQTANNNSKGDKSEKVGFGKANVTQITDMTLPLQRAKRYDERSNAKYSSCLACTRTNIMQADKAMSSIKFILNNTISSPVAKHCNHKIQQASTQSSPITPNQQDRNGYRFLAKHLQIEYNTILGRWMFSSEIRMRSIVAPMCRSLTCMETDMSVCGKTKDRKLFCLDDGVSWVVGNAKRKELYKDGEFLFVVDEKTGVVRRQTVSEVKRSRERIRRRMGKILALDAEGEYVPLLRYLEGA